MSGIEAIAYDPLKARLGRLVARRVVLRRLFYAMLGALFLRQWHVRAELKRIARRENVRDILDAGAGFGQYTHLMAKLFPRARILAVDVNEEQVEDGNWFAQRVGHAQTRFEFADLTTFVRPASFDLALAVDVMEHIIADEAVFQNIFSSLRERGLFVITTPVAADGTQAGDHVESVIGEHVRQGYTEAEFRDKLVRAGFHIERMDRIYGPLWGRIAWTLLQRIPMKLLARSKWFLIPVVLWITVVYLPAAFCMALDLFGSKRRGWGWLVIARKVQH